MYKNSVFICGMKAFYSDYGTDTSNQLQRWRQFYVYLLNVWGTCPKGGGGQMAEGSPNIWVHMKLSEPRANDHPSETISILK